MALKRKTDFDTGVSCDYIRITQVNFDFDAKICVVFLGFYLDSNSRSNGHKPYTTKQIELSGDNWSFNDKDFNNNPRALVYLALKQYVFPDSEDA